MGLFSRAKKRTPTIEIHGLKPENNPYRPNDLITGHVSITTPFTLQTKSVQISFSGISKVWIREHYGEDHWKHYRDEVALFKLEPKSLLREPQTMEIGQLYEFPFKFRMPGRCELDRSGAYKDPSNSTYCVGPQDLPPSSFSGFDEKCPDYALIKYGFTVQLRTEPHNVERWDGLGEKFSTVYFRPNDSGVQSEGLGFECRKNHRLQSSSLTGADPSKIGICKRLRDRFSSSTPKLDFQTRIQVPLQVKAGESFGVCVYVMAPEIPDCVTHTPPITFEVKNLKLVGFTCMRARRDWLSNLRSMGLPMEKPYRKPKEPISQHDRCFVIKTELDPDQKLKTGELISSPAHRLEDDKVMPREGRCEAFFQAHVPANLTPSFKSYGVAMVYRTQVNVVVTIGEQKFKYKMYSPVQQVI